MADNKVGVVYTPPNVASLIIFNVFKKWIGNVLKQEKLNLNLKEFNELNYESFKEKLIKAALLNKKIKDIIKNVKILDPSCGEGIFLLKTADMLFDILRNFIPDMNEINLKKRIVNNNIFGVEIEKEVAFKAKFNTCNWIFSESLKSTDKMISQGAIDSFFNKLDLSINIYNKDFLFDIFHHKFDLIIGNPPHVENKKIKDLNYKKRLKKRFKTAFKLFDLSILFVERSLELLKENSGYLAFIMPNKVLAADYGLKFRELIIGQTEIKECMNLSTIPLFKGFANYPIILILKKSKSIEENLIHIKIFKEIADFFSNTCQEKSLIYQSFLKKLPSKVIPISTNLKDLKKIFDRTKSMQDLYKNLEIIYRPFGFLNWNNYFEFVSDLRVSDDDKLLIGTSNIEKYVIRFEKLIKIAKKTSKISYFNMKEFDENIKEKIKGEKLIFREIAKDLTCVYDPGLFANITGLYFLKIPSLNTNEIFSLLAILNSKIMDYIFKSLFGSLHMAKGYLRFNGSFIKRLPIVNDIPDSIGRLAKINQILHQYSHELKISDGKISFPERNFFLIKEIKELFNKLLDSMVYHLYLGEKNKNEIDYLLETNEFFPNLVFKYFYPRYELKEYKIYTNNERIKTFEKINNLYDEILTNQKLMEEIKILSQKYL